MLNETEANRTLAKDPTGRRLTMAEVVEREIETGVKKFSFGKGAILNRVELEKPKDVDNRIDILSSMFRSIAYPKIEAIKHRLKEMGKDPNCIGQFEVRMNFSIEIVNRSDVKDE